MHNFLKLWRNLQALHSGSSRWPVGLIIFYLLSGAAALSGRILGKDYLLPAQLQAYYLWGYILLGIGLTIVMESGQDVRQGRLELWQVLGLTRDYVMGGYACRAIYLARYLLGAWALSFLCREGPHPWILAVEQLAFLLTACLLTGTLGSLTGILAREFGLMIYSVGIFFCLVVTPLVRFGVEQQNGWGKGMVIALLNLLPPLDLLFRPGSVIHHWPPLHGFTTLSIVFLGIFYAYLAAALAAWLHRLRSAS